MEPQTDSQPQSDFGQFGVLVLAAGASSRMGCAKLLLPWRGTSVIGHLYELWRGLGVAQVAIVMRPGDGALAAELDRVGWPELDRVVNPEPEQGMFSSIVCGARWNGWHQGLTGRIFVLGDQPHLRSEMLRGLLDFAMTQGNGMICQPAVHGKTGHPVLLPEAAVRELQNTRAGTLKQFLKLTAVPGVQFPVDDAGLSLDMDTPEDYKRIQDFHDR
jgi:molybdenum cofactor cytidylyltransferase